MENYETLVEKVIKENTEEILDIADFRFKCLHDSKLVEDFCEKYSVKLVKIDYDFTGSDPKKRICEPVYCFDDEFGGFTRKGLERSLKEEDSLVEQ